MAKKYDTETFILAITAYLKANFEAKLTEITNEKNDDITLTSVDTTGGYFVQTLNDKVVNYNPYIFIGIIDKLSSDSIESASAQQIPLEVALVIADSGEDSNLWIKLFRYQRAFKEIFENGWNKQSLGPRVSVQEYILPLPQEYKMQQVGVQLRAQLS
jgi:hypothetical protein